MPPYDPLNPWDRYPVPSPAEEDSLLSQIGRTALAPLQWLGETLGKPGAFVTGTLGGQADAWMNLIPFSDTLGLTDPSKRISGRDLLRQWNMADQEDTWGNFLGGLGVDIALDPLNLVGFGMPTKLGQTIAKQLGHKGLGWARHLDILASDAAKLPADVAAPLLAGGAGASDVARAALGTTRRQGAGKAAVAPLEVERAFEELTGRAPRALSKVTEFAPPASFDDVFGVDDALGSMGQFQRIAPRRVMQPQNIDEALAALGRGEQVAQGTYRRMAGDLADEVNPAALFVEPTGRGALLEGGQQADELFKTMGVGAPFFARGLFPDMPFNLSELPGWGAVSMLGGAAKKLTVDPLMTLANKVLPTAVVEGAKAAPGTLAAAAKALFGPMYLGKTGQNIQAGIEQFGDTARQGVLKDVSAFERQAAEALEPGLLANPGRKNEIDLLKGTREATETGGIRPSQTPPSSVAPLDLPIPPPDDAPIQVKMQHEDQMAAIREQQKQVMAKHPQFDPQNIEDELFYRDQLRGRQALYGGDPHIPGTTIIGPGETERIPTFGRTIDEAPQIWERDAPFTVKPRDLPEGSTWSAFEPANVNTQDYVGEALGMSRPAQQAEMREAAQAGKITAQEASQLPVLRDTGFPPDDLAQYAQLPESDRLDLLRQAGVKNPEAVSREMDRIQLPQTDNLAEAAARHPGDAFIQTERAAATKVLSDMTDQFSAGFQMADDALGGGGTIVPETARPATTKVPGKAKPFYASPDMIRDAISGRMENLKPAQLDSLQNIMESMRGKSWEDITKAVKRDVGKGGVQAAKEWKRMQDGLPPSWADRGIAKPPYPPIGGPPPGVPGQPPFGGAGGTPIGNTAEVLRQWRGYNLNRLREVGLNPELLDNLNLWTPRALAAEDSALINTAGKKISRNINETIEREQILKSLPRGTESMNEWVKNADLSGAGRRMSDENVEEFLLKQLNDKWAEAQRSAPDLASPTEASLRTQAEKLADLLKQMPREYVDKKLDFYRTDVIGDFKNASRKVADIVGLGEASLGNAAQQARTMDQWVAQGYDPARLVSVDQWLDDTKRTYREYDKNGNITNGAHHKVGKNLGLLENGALPPDALKDYYIPKELAKELEARITPFVAPESMQPILKLYDQYTGMFKTWVTLLRPAFYTRNLMDFAWRTWRDEIPLKTSFGAGKDMHKIIRGNLTPELRQMADEMARNRVALNPHATNTAEFTATSHVTPASLEKFSPKEVQRLQDIVSGMQADGVRVTPTKAQIKQQLAQAFPDRIKEATAAARDMGSREFRATPLGSSPDRKLLAGERGFMGKVKQFNQDMEDWMRGTHYIAKRRLGFSEEAAAMSVKKYHFDYSEITPAEREVFKRIMPFWTFSSRSAPSILSDLATKPGRVATTARVLNSGRSEGFVPSWLGGQAVPIPGAPEGQQRFLTSLGVPLDDVAFNVIGRLMSGQGGNAMRELLGATNPLIKTPVELATGKSLFTDRNLAETKASPLLSPLGPQDAGYMQSLLGLSPTIGPQRTLEQLFAAPQKGVGATAVNMLSGLRLADADIEKTREMEASRLLQRMLTSDGTAREFASVYVPKEKRAELSAEEQRMLGMLDVLNKRRQIAALTKRAQAGDQEAAQKLERMRGSEVWSAAFR